jgi:hypothetical protein
MTSFFGYAMQFLILLGTLMCTIMISIDVCTQEEVEKPEQDEEVVVKDQEEDLAEVHSPLKSDASDDGLFDWSQYKINY